jgi:hypothetical protein
VGRWSQGEFAALEVLERIWDERISHKVSDSRNDERDNKSKNGVGSWGGESGLFFSRVVKANGDERRKARQRSREGEEMGNATHEVTLVITTIESHCEVYMNRSIPIDGY